MVSFTLPFPAISLIFVLLLVLRLSRGKNRSFRTEMQSGSYILTRKTISLPFPWPMGIARFPLHSPDPILIDGESTCSCQRWDANYRTIASFSCRRTMSVIDASCAFSSDPNHDQRSLYAGRQAWQLNMYVAWPLSSGQPLSNTQTNRLSLNCFRCLHHRKYGTISWRTMLKRMIHYGMKTLIRWLRLKHAWWME